MRSSALSLLLVLATSTSAHAAFGRPDKATRQTRDAAFTEAKTYHGQVVTATKGLVGAAKLKTSPNLRWTRDILDRPHSDWGVEGIGKPFAEKRSALLNLRWAKGNTGVLRTRLTTLASAQPLSRAQRRWLSSATRELDAIDGEADVAREELRGTARIWSGQRDVLWGATGDQVRLLGAMLQDRPQDHATVESLVDQVQAARR